MFLSRYTQREGHSKAANKRPNHGNQSLDSGFMKLHFENSGSAATFGSSIERGLVGMQEPAIEDDVT